MPFTKIDKILIKKLLELKSYKAKQLVREFNSKGWIVGSIYNLLQKLQVTWLLGSLSGQQQWNTQLTTLIFLTNWCYTKIARLEIIFAHCT